MSFRRILLVAYGKLYAFAPDGSVIWQKAHTGSDNQTSIGPDGTIYVGSNTAELHAYAPDGTLRWTFPRSFVSHPLCGRTRA